MSENFFKETVNELKEKNLDWKIKVLQGPSSARARVEGKEVIMLCSNNYLGLSNHPVLKEAAINAVKEFGVGSGSVRPIAGTMELHEKLEKTIAEFKEIESALYYNSGYTVNSGLIPAMMGEKDLIVSEELNHGSIIDGVRLSKASKAVYKHKDMEDLKRVLEENNGKFKKTLIVSDGVFSMDGDITPLDKIVKLAKEFDAMVYVDDAHGDGVLGEKGKGIVHHFGLKGKVDIEMGTFSKAFGTMGGYIAGSKELTEFALNKSRTWLLTGSQAPATVAASITALELLERDASLVKRLWKNTGFFKKALKDLGFDTGESETPITPIMVGESSVAQRFSELLFKEGVFALPIFYPMVAQGKARIRTIVNAELTEKDLNQAIERIELIGKKLEVI